MADGGTKLRQLMGSPDGLSHWGRVLPDYSRLQVALSSHAGQLHALAVPDRRLSVLPALFDRLLTETGLMAYQRQGRLEAGQVRRLLGDGSYFQALCADLHAYGLPETLDHGDLHDGNIFIQGERHVVFDWGDCSLSHPFFSLRTVAVSLAYRPGLAPDSPEYRQLLDLYFEPWLGYLPHEELRECLALAQGIVPIADALRWHRALAHLEGRQRSEFAHGIPSLLQEYLESNEALR